MWHNRVFAAVLSKLLGLVSLAAGHANLAALEVHWLQCGIGGEFASDPFLAKQETLTAGKGLTT